MSFEIGLEGIGLTGRDCCLGVSEWMGHADRRDLGLGETERGVCGEEEVDFLDKCASECGWRCRESSECDCYTVSRMRIGVFMNSNSKLFVAQHC